MDFKAGAAQVDITPPVGCPQAGFASRTDVSKGVHDPLLAKALVLDDGSTEVALVTCDLLGLDKESVAKIRDLAQQRSGLTPANVIVACSHTHSGPALTDPGYLAEHVAKAIVPGWTEALPYVIAGAVQMAHANREPARIGVAQGACDIGVNRRSRGRDGATTIGPNPQGPTDPTLTVLRVDRADGSPLAWLMNYACHAVVLGGDNLLISADYPGYATRILERARGDGLMAMFANGTAGNINPRLRGTFEMAQQLGMAAAGEALRVAEKAPTSPTPHLRVSSQEVLLPLKDMPPLKTLQESLQAKRAQLEADRQAGRLPEDISGVRGEVIRAAHQVHMVEQLGRFERPGDLKAGKKRAQIQAFALDDAAFVALPGEVFVEVGLAIKQHSPYPTTAVLGYANDYSVCYVPTRESYDQGGYEPNWAIVDRGAAEILEEEASALLARLHESSTA